MWWDSIETLTKLYSIFQWTAIICAFLAALASGAAFKFGSRLSSLQATQITELKVEVTGRRLTPEMREKIQTSLKPMPNVKLEFTSIQVIVSLFFLLSIFTMHSKIQAGLLKRFVKISF